MSRTIGSTEITCVEGDLTAMEVDVVVNAANERLDHGGGLAAALASAGGPEVQEASDAWVEAFGPVERGAAITTAGSLPAAALVHVVGPRYRGDGADEPKLRAAVRAALHAAAALGASSVALPAISSGVFGYPLAEATGVIADEATRWCEQNDGALGEIRLVGYDEATAAAFGDGLDAAARD
ncbi:MAG: macro domain-containing protein [Acidimicrobiia bacterium]|nr:macro domain-containing protein [Acidimicrobiia bacterium]